MDLSRDPNTLSPKIKQYAEKEQQSALVFIFFTLVLPVAFVLAIVLIQG